MSAKRGWGTVWGVLTVIGCLVGIRPAHAEKMIETRIPVEFARQNPCTGEWVKIQGEQILIFKITENSSGGVHVDLFSSTHGEGIGEQGNLYRLSEQDHNIQNIQGDLDHFSSTHVIHFNLISRGSAPNFVSRALLHVTFENGKFEAVLFQFQEECRG